MARRGTVGEIGSSADLEFVWFVRKKTYHGNYSQALMDYNSFDHLFAELESFSPIIENSDLSEISYDPPSKDSFISPSNIPISSSKLHYVSQNSMKSNVLMHSLLNVSSSSPFSTDIILFQEP